VDPFARKTPVLLQRLTDKNVYCIINYIWEMATDELEFEAPLARFDVEEWTEYHENTSDEEDSVYCPRNFPDYTSSGVSDISVAVEKESSDSSNATENFSETCSGSLEDLVNSFDQRVTKCCRNYEEQVERLAPVQVRSQEEAHDSWSVSCISRVSLNHDGTDGPGIQSSRLSRLCAVRRDGATYQIWFRLPVPNTNPKSLTLTLTLTLKVTIMYAV